MSDSPSSTTPIDLERAQFEASAPTSQLRCSVCQRELSGSYFDVNGLPACEGCRYRVEEEFHKGAGTRGFLKALVAGGVAAVAGFLLYWAIEDFTGYEFGLIAIVVGLMVGKAVHWGAGGRGGWAYQTLAIVLTYLAIAATYVPPLVKQMRAERAAQATSAASATTDTATPGTTSPENAPAAGATPDPRAPLGASEFLMGLGMLLALAAALPFLAGIKNFLGILILGFGVYEAWKINRRPKLVITGPLRLGDAPPPTP